MRTRLSPNQAPGVRCCVSQPLPYSSISVAALQPVWSGLEQFLALPHPALPGGVLHFSRVE
eukprot:13510607-Alexandrium_andersonii.AAC.1